MANEKIRNPTDMTKDQTDVPAAHVKQSVRGLGGVTLESKTVFECCHAA